VSAVDWVPDCIGAVPEPGREGISVATLLGNARFYSMRPTEARWAARYEQKTASQEKSGSTEVLPLFAERRFKKGDLRFPSLQSPAPGAR
jgi:hypothetical protein